MQWVMGRGVSGSCPHHVKDIQGMSRFDLRIALLKHVIVSTDLGSKTQQDAARYVMNFYIARLKNDVESFIIFPRR